MFMNLLTIEVMKMTPENRMKLIKELEYVIKLLNSNTTDLAECNLREIFAELNTLNCAEFEVWPNLEIKRSKF